MFMNPQKTYNAIIFIEEYTSHALPNPNEIIIVGTMEHPKWATFQCPCGCGEFLAVNLMVSVSPCWEARFDTDGRVTFSPSVRVINSEHNCRSHFFIRNNHVDWC